MSNDIRFEFHVGMDKTSYAMMEEIEVRTCDAYVVRVRNVKFDFYSCKHPEIILKLAPREIPGIVREAVACHNRQDFNEEGLLDSIAESLVKRFNRDVDGENGIVCCSAEVKEIIFA